MLELLTQFAKTAEECNVNGFLGFRPWYQYLPLDSECSPRLESLNSVWAVAAAIFEMLLRLGSVIAVFFIIWGAFSIIMSQGEPERIKQGKGTIINAVIGLVVTVLAATIVSVIAKRLVS